MSAPRKTNDAGFTVLESLVALGMLAMATFVLLNLNTIRSKDAIEDQRRALAIQLASNNMEDLLRRYSTDPLLSPGAHELRLDVNGKAGGAAPYFTVRWEVEPNNPISNTMRIDERVEWQVNGVTRHVELRSYRSSM